MITFSLHSQKRETQSKDRGRSVGP